MAVVEKILIIRAATGSTIHRMLTLLVLCGTKTVWIRSERRVATTGRFAVPSQRISQKPKPTETVPRQFQPELSLEKSQISLATLIMALFYDLATEKDFKIPTQPERRERALRDLIKKRQKPIALFIDDAHDLHSKTLIGLKRLIEVIRDSGGMLSVVLAGHSKLKNDLRRSSMEEIGSRATIFEGPARMLSVCSQIIWFHSHVMWF
jgi:hypothetical protein